jgi:hypothetical protein
VGGDGPDQQRELSRQELANVLSVDIWFENLLNRLLLRGDSTSATSHYTLTEMADECRHMMFGKLIERVEARPYWPRHRRRRPTLRARGIAATSSPSSVESATDLDPGGIADR